MVKYIWKYYLYMKVTCNFKFKRYFYKQKKTVSEIAEKNEILHTFIVQLL